MTPGVGSGHRALAVDLAGKSAILYIGGQILDLITTYRLTPWLGRESNIVVAQLGLGWGYVLGSAAVLTLVMTLALFWMWPRLLQRFPDPALDYRGFYHRVLYDSDEGSPIEGPTKVSGVFIAITCFLGYALITDKLLAGVWNLSLMIGVRPMTFGLMLVVKGAIAAAVGLVMFFLYPYLLHRRLATRH